MDPNPTIAIVGRPNVGKSTLFNRLIGKKHAIIADEAGTTRDRISMDFDCNGYNTTLVDTGGIEYGKQENIEADVQMQAKAAIQDADLILFIVDSLQELTKDDFSAADILRKSKKTVMLVANKCDNQTIEDGVYNMYELGFGEPIKISAIHKGGIEELKSEMEKSLKKLKYKKNEKKKVDEKQISISILGKPNAGKSSLTNALLGLDKVIVSSIPGTTRDTVDIPITYNKKKYNLIDTAGLRRRGKIERGIERFSSLRCINAIDRSQVVVILIDGEKGVTNQDTHIAEYALKGAKGVIIAINKIDLFEDKEEKKDRFITRLRKKFSFIPWAPVVFISAKDKINIYTILELADEIVEERRKRIKTSEINAFFQKITYKHMPASAKNKKPKFMYGTQADINPPTFALFLKNSENLHFSYPRYLENEIRKEYGFNGTAIKLRFKNTVRENPEK